MKTIVYEKIVTTMPVPVSKNIGSFHELLYISNDYFISDGDNKIQIWNSNGSKYDKEIPFKNGIRGFACDSRGEFLVAASLTGSVKIFNKWGVPEIKTDPRREVISVSVSPSDRYLALGTGSENGKFGTLCIADFKTGTILHEKNDFYSAPIATVVFGFKGKYLISRSTSGTIRIFKLKYENESVSIDKMVWQSSSKTLKTLDGMWKQYGGWITRDLIVSPDDQNIIMGNKNGTIGMIPLSSIQSKPSYERFPLKKSEKEKMPDKVTCLVASPDGRYLISGSRDGSVYLWDLKERVFLSELPKCSQAVRSIVISPDGEYLVVGSNSGSIHIWNFHQWICYLRRDEIALESTLKQREEDNDWVITHFFEIACGFRLLTLESLRKMFAKTHTIDTFQLSYSLVKIFQMGNKTFTISDLKGAVYECLIRLTKTCQYQPDQDQKHSDNDFQGSENVGKYMCIVEAAFNDQFIKKYQLNALNYQAQTHGIFLNPQFKNLQNKVTILEKQVELHSNQIKILGNGIKDLQAALKQKNRRELVLGVAKVVLPFLTLTGADLITQVMHLSDLSKDGLADISKIGEQLFNINAEQCNNLIEKGLTAVKEHLGDVEIALIQKAGYSPEEFLKTWMEASYELRQPLLREEKEDNPLNIKIFPKRGDSSEIKLDQGSQPNLLSQLIQSVMQTPPDTHPITPLEQISDQSRFEAFREWKKSQKTESVQGFQPNLRTQQIPPSFERPSVQVTDSNLSGRKIGNSSSVASRITLFEPAPQENRPGVSSIPCPETIYSKTLATSELSTPSNGR